LRITDSRLLHYCYCLLPCLHVAQFLKFGDGPTDAQLVNNDDWLSGLGYVQFLREYGTHFTINRMLSFESVKLRLEREQPLTFLEFNYMLLQAYDFVELHRRYGCRSVALLSICVSVKHSLQ
jgi:tyrosyl-tRNA synthetase